ncbi:hypothetical protein [Acinetobacter larvae]|uniref:Uncharacterized protein n=1 Tax=Acinetobacter larvae TaxID=1789224 RepID=A0A1B2LWS6_9GAMM|nr:hypothetical protein [Acinetobacter larvae]AOA57391.1 hypothetical protein BFG52_02785 [Acinetobacter larvae]
MSQTKKRGALAPFVIVGVTAGFLYAAYRFVFAKKKKLADLHGAVDLAPVSTTTLDTLQQQAATAAAELDVIVTQSAPKAEDEAQQSRVATAEVQHTDHGIDNSADADNNTDSNTDSNTDNTADRDQDQSSTPKA